MTTRQGQTQTPASIMTFGAVEADSETQALPERLHLLRVGKFHTDKYGDLDINSSDLQEMVANFDKGLGRAGGGTLGVPVNIAHNKAGVAAAWINGLETDGTDLWGVKTEWSATGKSAIENKEYKCLSSEFTPRCLGGDWVNPENTDVKAKNVFTGAGLTNIPMFTGNRPVMASATSDAEDGETKEVIYINATSNNKEKNMPVLDEVRVKAAADLTDEEKTFINADAQKSQLTPEEKTKFGIEAAADNKPAEKPKAVDASAIKGDEGVVSVNAADIKSLVDRVAAVEATNEAHRKVEAAAFVDKQIERGAIVADQKDGWVEQVLASDTAKTLLEKLPDNKLMAKEIGKEGDAASIAATAQDELMVKAKKIVADSEGKVLLDAATKSVLASDTDLVDRLNAERNLTNNVE